MALGRLSRRPALALAVAGSGLVIALGGCGSGAKSADAVSHAQVSATSYVTALCQAVAPFEAGISQAKTLEAARSLSPAKGKQVLVTYLGTLSADGNSAVTRLRAAGIPQVTGGAGYSASVLSTFTRISGTLNRSETVAKNLSTSSASVYHTGATNLGTAVKESIGEILAGLKRPNKALDTAASKVSACHQL